MSIIHLIDLDVIGDDRGELISLEEMRNVPFSIKRVYYMFHLHPDKPRGFHAHKDLQQVAICVSGRCRMVLRDGVQQEEVWLDSPKKGRITPKIPPFVKKM